MNEYQIIPFVGALPITFSMTPEDVHRILGRPNLSNRNFLGDLVENWGNVSIGYEKATNTVFHIGFLPTAKLVFQNISLFDEVDPIKTLIRFDSCPYQWVGFVIFFELGIRIAGFHDHDESQKSICIVRKGYWDTYKSDFERFEVERQ